MANPAIELLNGLLDLVYPPKCLACDTFGEEHLCESCIGRIEPVAEPTCARCGHTLHISGCTNCEGRVRSFTKARGAAEYDAPLREAIHEFKYNGRRMLARPLGEMMHRYLDGHDGVPWLKAECIIPVPIHPIRQRLRGYNQSELLARHLSERTDIPLVADLLIRSRHTKPQVLCSREERRTNLVKAFRVVNPAAICGKTVLLVDDVSTTGSTIHEASIALRRAGVERIYALCLAYGG
ncbi:MAG: ComF family protein [Armatimonadetes bacterium]|nr:ComF family protein [Armatimonadota bacterium]